MAATHNIKASRVSEVIEMTGLAWVRSASWVLPRHGPAPTRRMAPDRHRDQRAAHRRHRGPRRRRRYPPSHRRFTLAAEAQGHGYATEALRTVISLLFPEHDVHRVRADCDTRNDHSVALLERIGMRREAHHHK